MRDVYGRPRVYLGIMSASLGSTQTDQVRVWATLWAGLSIAEHDRDGYWTNPPCRRPCA